MFKPSDLFDLSQTEHAALFEGCEHAWDALKKLKAYIDARTKSVKYENKNPRITIGEHVIIGDGSVIGNSCEFKHSLLFNHGTVPHFSYVGDSIFGYKAHLGAGVKISNVKLMPGNVMLDINGAPHDTGLRKFGALLGDHTDIGCNSVLNPGSIIGRGSVIYPNTSWRGILPANMIVKNKAEQEVVVRRPRG